MIRPLLVLPLLLTLAACGGGSSKAVTRNGVTVAAVLKGGDLAVTFTPKAGYHLYSTSLPVGGADGVGLATRVAVSGPLRAAGEATANQPVHDLTVDGVDAPVPVYPEGPVTLHLPVSGTKGTATVQYAACSDKVCLAPVPSLALSVG